MYSQEVNAAAQKLSKAVARASKQFMKETGFVPGVHVKAIPVQDVDGDCIDVKYQVHVSMQVEFAPSNPV